MTSRDRLSPSSAGSIAGSGSLEDRIGALDTRINSLASSISLLDRKVDDVAAGIRTLNTDMDHLRNLRGRVQ